MGGGINGLTEWRIEKARRTVIEAQKVYEQEMYEVCLNRAYYAAFYAMQAANSLYHFDSKKHSGVISFFRKTLLKTRIMDSSLSKIITDSSIYREKVDYEDMYEATAELAEGQLKKLRNLLKKYQNFYQRQENVK